MAIGMYPEGFYRMEDDEYVSRGSGVISDNVNPSIEFLIDRNLPVKANNAYWGSAHRHGQILAGADVIMSINGTEYDDMGYLKPTLSICNGYTGSATESNGVVRTVSKPVGTLLQHAYNYMNDRLVDINRPSINRGQTIAVPYLKDPYLADQVWVGAAVGGSGSTVGTGNNTVGQAYSSDYRLSTDYLLSAGDLVQSDHNGHFMKYIPLTDTVANFALSERKIVGQVMYVEELPMRGLLQYVMYKADPTMFSMYDYSRPYNQPTFGGKDGRSFMAPDKGMFPNNYGAIDLYKWPEHLKDGMGLPGLTDGSRIASTDATEVVTNVAITSSVHTITLTYGPIARSEQGSVNPSSVTDGPSKLTCKWSSANNGSYDVTLREGVDFTVDRYTKVVTIRSNRGASLAATDDYTFTYTYLNSQKFGVPTNADWKGSCGLVYITTFFNR